jgi:F-type H+-transporting ATPase subunit epsilon
MVIETKDSKEISVAINGGYVKVEETKTLCVVDGAVALNADDSDLASSIAEAKELLSKAGESSTALASAMSKVDSMGKKF